jgi:hypothetical protein
VGFAPDAPEAHPQSIPPPLLVLFDANVLPGGAVVSRGAGDLEAVGASLGETAKLSPSPHGMHSGADRDGEGTLVLIPRKEPSTLETPQLSPWSQEWQGDVQLRGVNALRYRIRHMCRSQPLEKGTGPSSSPEEDGLPAVLVPPGMVLVRAKKPAFDGDDGKM